MCGKEVKRPQLSNGSTARDPTPAHSSVGIENTLIMLISSVNCSMVLLMEAGVRMHCSRDREKAGEGVLWYVC